MSFWVLPNTFLMHKKLRLLKKRFFWQILFFFSKSDDRAFPACTMGVARPQKYKKRSLLQAWRGRKGNPPPGEAGHVDGGRWISLNSKRQLWVSRILDFLQWRWVGEAKYGGCPRGMTFWQGPKTLELYYTAWCVTRHEMYTEISARLSICACRQAGKPQFRMKPSFSHKLPPNHFPSFPRRFESCREKELSPLHR